MPPVARLNYLKAATMPLQPQGCITSESRLAMNFLNLISYFPQYSRNAETQIDLASLTR